MLLEFWKIKSSEKKKKRFPSHEEKQINRRSIIVFPSLFVAMRIKEILNRSN